MRRVRRLPTAWKDSVDQLAGQVRRLSADAWDRLSPLLNTIRESRDERIEVATARDQMLRRARMYSENLVHILQTAWELEGSESTAYGLLNALTRVATHEVSLSTRHRLALARLSSVLAHDIFTFARIASVHWQLEEL